MGEKPCRRASHGVNALQPARFPEVWSRILSYLAPPDLAAALRVSRGAFALAAPRLYSNLTFQPCTPVFPSLTQQAFLERHTSLFEPLLGTSSTRSAALRHTKHVVLHPHSASSCAALTSVPHTHSQLPPGFTLTIVLPDSPKLEFCVDPFGLNHQCGFFKVHRPTTLVLVGVKTLDQAVRPDLAVRHLPRSLKRLVILMEGEGFGCESGSGESVRNLMEMKGLEQVDIVRPNHSNIDLAPLDEIRLLQEPVHRRATPSCHYATLSKPYDQGCLKPGTVASRCAQPASKRWYEKHEVSCLQTRIWLRAEVRDQDKQLADLIGIDVA